MKNILITGGAGFIGSHFIEHFAQSYPQYNIINLDLLTYAGNLNNLSFSSALSNYHFIQGDICDKALLRTIFETHKIDSVIHFAAQSHVDNSISSPQEFITTNIQGTFALLETARMFWHELDSKLFCHISTDEVYGSLGEHGKFSESSPYAPNSPYSASKASSDMLVRSYFHTYNLPTIITNCSNNYGTRQHSEKLIPTIIRNALQSKPIPIYGDGKNIRDWLYVGDHCRAIDTIIHFCQENNRFGESFAIGGDNEHSNLSLAHIICEKLDLIAPKSKSYKEQIQFVKDRAGHDRRYAINSSKLQSLTSWRPLMSFEDGLEETIKWYINRQ